MPGPTEMLPGPLPNTVRTAAGEVLTVPAGWILVPPGDAALTRRIKQAGAAWQVAEKRGRKVFSRGTWAPAETVEAIRAALDRERADPAHGQRLARDRARRDAQEIEYRRAFGAAVLTYLAFAPRHRELAVAVAEAIAEHATPVGSGTVARTKRIPIEQRAEAATIAWLRHQTTAYDDMKIPRVKGMRREVRRLLAAASKNLLARYRAGEPIDPARCILRKGLARHEVGAEAASGPTASHPSE